MPERPLVLFAAPTVADKERRYGGAPKYYFPSHSRQVSRLTPQFNVLQNTMNSGSIYFTNYATGVDPEYTLVFETVGDPHDFYKAVDKLKETYPTVENNSIEVWDIDESIELKINCRGCASENNPEMLIPYALFATFEMAPDCGVEVYQKVVTKVQTKNAIKTM